MILLQNYFKLILHKKKLNNKLIKIFHLNNKRLNLIIILLIKLIMIKKKIKLMMKHRSII